jgi:Zn-dependent protease with chaperone function
LPAAEAIAPVADGSVARVLAGFRAETVAPSPLSPWYRAAMGVVAFVMVLLPLIYVALIVAAGAGVYWYAINGGELLSDVRGRAYVFAYGAPLFTGVVLLFFMVKPLFARPPKAPEPIVLDRATEPAVWALVEKICRAVRAPVPRTIAVDAEVNASAGFERGWLGFFTGRLRLTIGLPLAAGLQLDELAGVLAHEFGHFAQGGGMRVSFVVRSVSAWFARVVYERDSWDQRLASLGEIGGWASILTMIAAAMVWLGRRVLWCLMWIGYAVSSYLMRQMEYDADSYEARLVGSETTVRTSGHIVHLSIGSQRAWELVNEHYRTGRVPGDLPTLIAGCTSQIPEAVKERIHEAQAHEKSGLFDTHPTTRDRDAAARSLAQPGIFASDLPATCIFSDYTTLAREVTRHRYEVVAGADLSKVQLTDNTAIVAGEQERVRTLTRVDEVFGGLIDLALPLPLTADPAVDPAPTEPQPELLARLRDTVAAAAPALASWRDLQSRAITHQAVAVLLSAGCERIARRIEGVDTAGGGSAAYERLEALRAEALTAGRELDPALARVAAFLGAAVTVRLAACADDSAREGVRAEWQALIALGRLADHARRLAEYRNGLGGLFTALQEGGDAERIMRIAESTAALARRQLDEVFASLRHVPCPLPDAPPGTQSMRDYLTPEMEDGEHAVVTTFRRADRFVDGGAEAMRRLVGNLLNATVPVAADAPSTTG